MSLGTLTYPNGYYLFNFPASSAGLTVTLAPSYITFYPLPNLTAFADPQHPTVPTTFPLTARSSSGDPVVYQVVSGPATVNGAILTLTGTGPVTVMASTPGGTNFAAATPVLRSFIAQ